MDFNPTRLSLARRRRGLTKKRLAEATELGERTITAYERGERTPTEEPLRRLASTLGFLTSFFARPDIDPVPGRGASFRALSKMTAAQRDGALASGELALELNQWIEERFVLPTPDLPNLRPQPNPEAAAAALRSRWGLGDKPITNMVRLLESKGIRVFSLVEECREVDAFSFWRGMQPFVFLNTMKSAERSRFDAAHELGHLVLHHHGEPNGREAERDADRFAAAFLMPRSSIVAFAPRNASLKRLIDAKHHWGVSVSALVYRMHDVGMLSDWHYRSLFIEMQQLGFRKKEPEAGKREMSLVLEKVFSALREDGVSRTDLARTLGWPLSELQALVFQLVVTPIDGGAPSTASTSDTFTKRQLRLMR